MVAQDSNDRDDTSYQFSIVLRALFPDIDSPQVSIAAREYADALFLQSTIKDSHTNEYSGLYDDKWEQVRRHLCTMCGLLKLSSSYAHETVEFFRYHSARDDAYVKHVFEAHKILSRRVLKSDKFYRTLAGLYLSAISLHDMHESAGVALGKRVMELYFRIILDARSPAQMRF